MFTNSMHSACYTSTPAYLPDPPPSDPSEVWFRDYSILASAWCQCSTPIKLDQYLAEQEVVGEVSHKATSCAARDQSSLVD